MEITTVIKSDFLVFQDESTLSEMLGQLKQYEKRAGLVFRNKKYLGLVEKRKLLRSNVNPTQAKVGNFINKSPSLKDHSSVIEAATLMAGSSYNLLPVEQDKKIVGVVEGIDIASLAMDLNEFKKTKVQDVKFSKPKIVQRKDKISSAISIMQKQQVDHVPVFEKGKLYGIISYRDLMRKYLNWSPKRNFSAKFNKSVPTKSARVDTSSFGNLPVENFCQTTILKTQSKDPLKFAVKSMSRNRVSDLLVMDNEQFKGILTLKNILKSVGTLKIPKRNNISFIGLNELNLTKPQIAVVKKISANESFKLERLLKNEFNLIIHIKDYSKKGKQQKYSVHLRAEAPGKMFTASQEDWDLRTAVRKTFENMKNELAKKRRK